MQNIENIVRELALSDNREKKKKLAKAIREKAIENNIYPWTINDFYLARGKGELNGFTVPAINLRTLTFDLARAIFRVARKLNAGAFIFEIAKSEMGYTAQIPAEYTSACLAAAIAEKFSGPVFIQGDHFQLKAEKYKENPQKEIENMKLLIKDAIGAGFYNIDIDSSTLVDLSKPTTKEQQLHNYKVCALLTEFIRKIQPQGLDVSIGGEIGEVGGKNSTPEELRFFMQGYKELIGENTLGISKMSIQTGTSHGGVILPDGTVAKVKLDFDTLKKLSKLARDEFGMAGAVQHGASTLPNDAFGKFPEIETAEVHLATQFQNIIYDSPFFPAQLKEKIYAWIKENLSNERKEGQTEEQFIYKTRKKALGPFKEDIINLPADIKKKIVSEVEKEFQFLFEKLRIKDTKDLVSKYIKPKAIRPDMEDEDISPEIDGEGDD
ncbi:MAG: class II fructose-bisphosphate aldolase [Candidatus Omnitrophota bacterium]|nr:MAG: class II fructose-bisphosphate aldolase [Candidatus Omnitrophota bacterium]